MGCENLVSTFRCRPSSSCTRSMPSRPSSSFRFVCVCVSVCLCVCVCVYVCIRVRGGMSLDVGVERERGMAGLCAWVASSLRCSSIVFFHSAKTRCFVWRCGASTSTGTTLSSRSSCCSSSSRPSSSRHAAGHIHIEIENVCVCVCVRRVGRVGARRDGGCPCCLCAPRLMSTWREWRSGCET
jgi:hypothetical protein